VVGLRTWAAIQPYQVVKWLMLRLLLLVPCGATCAVIFLGEVWFIWASTPCCMKLIEENKNISLSTILTYILLISYSCNTSIHEKYIKSSF
jgi:hypothetical protein